MKGALFIASFVMAFQVVRSPLLSSTPQKYSQSKWQMWFINNNDLCLKWTL